MEKFEQKSINDCLLTFSTSPNGLTQGEAEKRLKDCVKYQITPNKKRGFLSKFFAQLKELMVLVLLISGIISIFIGGIEKSNSEIVDGIIILGIVFVNSLFGAYQERKSEKAIENLKKMTQPEAIVIRGGRTLKIKTSELVLGDVVFLEAGCIVPADLRLIEDFSLKIDESSLTGESEPVEKFSGCVYEKDVPLGDRKNMAFAGSLVESGHGKGVVVALGIESELGKIAQSIKDTKKELTPLQKSIQSVGKILTYLILLMASITFILEVVVDPKNILNAFLTAVAISVAAIPESMPAVITIIMSMGISKLSKQKAIIKHLYAVETLGACDTICSDKTGTITQNKMKMQRFFTFFDEKSSNFEIFLNCMVLCNDSKLGVKGYVGASTEVALLNFAKNKIDVEKSRQNFLRLDEIEFNSDRKMMSVLCKVHDKKVVFTKGALDRILSRCSCYLDNDGVKPMSPEIINKIKKQNKMLCDDALRVIGFAFKESNSLDENNLVFLGICGLQDPPRLEIEDAVKKCRKSGMRPVMITGDYKDTAFAIAKQVEIAKTEKECMSGEEIDLYNDEEFLNIVENYSVFARVSPAHKVKIVQALKKKGHIVAMTGDGVNDAPSLKMADIGIGMGKTGTDVTKNVADVIITDDNFATIVVAVEEGRKIYSNIQKTIKYLFSANMAEILALFLTTIFLPDKTFLLPVQILFVNLITDSLPAIALGMEKVESDVMDRPPRKSSEGLFSGGMGTSLIVLGTIQTILTLSAYLFGLFVYNEAIAITMAFYTLNLIQLFYMFTARTSGYCFKSNPFKNKFFNLSLALGFGLLILFATTNLRYILKLQNLDWLCWLVVFTLSISIIFFGELYKFLANLKNRQKFSSKQV